MSYTVNQTRSILNGSMQPIKNYLVMMEVGGGWSVYPEVRVSVNNKKKAGPDIMGAEPGARRSERNRGYGKVKGGKSKVDGVQVVGDRSGLGQDSG